MRTSPVVVHETKPATEWILGAPVQKVSPRYAHAALQTVLASALRSWARGRGRVGTEWRFWLAPAGEELRYLVPDVAYLSYDRLARSANAAAQEPVVPPDVAFELLSADDRAAHVAHKVDVYLRSGARAVIVVDPADRLLQVFDEYGARTFNAPQAFDHPTLPGFTLDLAEFFAEAER